MIHTTLIINKFRPSWRLPWSWSYGSWIYNYPCNQCLSPLTLWVWTPLRRGVLDTTLCDQVCQWGILDTTLCDQVCQWLVAGQWLSPVSSFNKTGHHDITEILLKVVLKHNNSNQTVLCLCFLISNRKEFTIYIISPYYDFTIYILNK